MIEAVSLSRSFGAVRAVHAVSFQVDRGEAVGFVGPNGAGKTTTFRMLCGSLGPTAGTVRIAGVSLTEQPLRAKAQLGYMPESPPLYPEMTPREYLLYRAELKGLGSRKQRLQAVERWSDETACRDVLDARIGHLSKGYRQRVALADALLADPAVLLLDEPTAGLDPNQVLDVRRLIARLAEDKAVLLSTHILSEVEAACSRALVIHRGQLVAGGTLAELRRKRGTSKAEIRVAGLSCETIEALLDGQPLLDLEEEEQDQPEAEGPSDEAHRPTSPVVWVTVSTTDDASVVSRVTAGLLEAGGTVLEASPVRAPLDEAFAELTGHLPAGKREP